MEETYWKLSFFLTGVSVLDTRRKSFTMLFGCYYNVIVEYLKQTIRKTVYWMLCPYYSFINELPPKMAKLHKLYEISLKFYVHNSIRMYALLHVYTIEIILVCAASDLKEN